jgi:hypothetical protein
VPAWRARRSPGSVCENQGAAQHRPTPLGRSLSIQAFSALIRIFVTHALPPRSCPTTQQGNHLSSLRSCSIAASGLSATTLVRYCLLCGTPRRRTTTSYTATRSVSVNSAPAPQVVACQSATVIGRR